MPFLNLDDGYADHPKHARLSDGAFRLLTAALCYCSKHKTDGMVDPIVMPTLHPRYRAAYLRELLTSHPERPDVIETPDGYHVRDYLQWNRSRGDIEEARGKARKRQKAWRETHLNDDGSYRD